MIWGLILSIIGAVIFVICMGIIVGTGLFLADQQKVNKTGTLKE